MWLILLLNLVILKSTKTNLLTPASDQFIFEFSILELVETIEQQYDIQTILIKYDESVESCGELDIYLKYFKASIIIENLRKTWFLRNSLNKNLLSIVCLNKLTADYNIELAPYFRTVRSLRDTKLVVYINRNESLTDLTKLENFFKLCLKRKSLNVLTIFKDAPYTRHLHSYKPFPKFEMELKRKISTEVLYPNRIKNLMGHDFLTLPDQITPRTFLTTNKEEKLKMSGYVGHFINLLAERLNATLKFPFPIKKGEVRFYATLESLTQNYTVDLPGTLVPVVEAKQILYYSHPFEVVTSCLMIPTAQNVPLQEIFFHLINLELTTLSIVNLYLFTLLLNLKRISIFRKHRRQKRNHHVIFSDYVLNDVALRGILGQPFKVWLKAEFFTKYIYVLLSLTGLYLSLIYSAFLQTFFTRPFKEPQLRTFQDLYDQNLYTLVSHREMKYFTDANMKFEMLHLKTSYKEFDKMRNTLNTSYAYPNIYIHWNSLFSHQQNLLKNKLFIFSKDACLFHSYMLSFPLAVNSIYRDAVQELILNARDYGLISHWLTTNFPDDSAMNKNTPLVDLRSIDPIYGQPLKIHDFELVFVLYVGLMVMGILLFIMEIIFYRFKKLLTKRKK